MPKLEKYTLSSLNSKEFLLYSDVENSEFCTTVDNKINASKLMFKRFPEKTHTDSQKLIFTDVNQILKSDASSKQFQESESYFPQNEWRKYKTFKNYSVNGYSSILFMKPLVSGHLKSKEFSCDTNFCLTQTHSNTSLPIMLTYDDKNDETVDSTYVQETCTSKDLVKINKCDNLQNISTNVPLPEISKCVLSQIFSPCESISFLSNSDLTKGCCISSIHPLTSFKYINKNCSAVANMNFITAIVKELNKSFAAMFEANKLCQKKKLLSNQRFSNIVKHGATDKMNKSIFKRKFKTKDASLLKIFENWYSQKSSFCKYSATIPKQLKLVQSSNAKNLELDNFDVSENIHFPTVAKEAISVSNSSIIESIKQNQCNENEIHSKTDNVNVNNKDAYQTLKSDVSSKHFKVSDLYPLRNNWRQYKKFKSHSIESYSRIPFVKPLICNISNSRKSSCKSNLHLLQTHSNIDLPLLLTSNNNKDEIKNCIKDDACDNVQNRAKIVPLREISRCVLPQVSSQHSTLPNNDHESTLISNIFDSTKSSSSISSSLLTNVKSKNENYSAMEEVNFTTATGKVINISSAAMSKANKLYENEKILPEINISDIAKHEVSEKSNNFNSKRKLVIKDATSLSKIFDDKCSQKQAFCDDNENVSKKIKLDNFGAFEDLNFSTAAGKNISISNTAIETAQTLIYKFVDETAINDGENLQNEKSNVCTSKAEDVDMDNILIEKIFEDIQFDDEEHKLILDDMNEKTNESGSGLKTDNLPTHKPRKSLGGRMRLLK